MTKADHAAKSEQQVEADCSNRKNHDSRAEIDKKDSSGPSCQDRQNGKSRENSNGEDASEDSASEWPSAGPRSKQTLRSEKQNDGHEQVDRHGRYRGGSG